MSWDRKGQEVNAVYAGVPVSGVVTKSRVKYGGTVCHYLDLHETAYVYQTPRDSVVVEEGELVA